jgi:hypothetical protein
VLSGEESERVEGSSEVVLALIEISVSVAISKFIDGVKRLLEVLIVMHSLQRLFVH